MTLPDVLACAIAESTTALCGVMFSRRVGATLALVVDADDNPHVRMRRDSGTWTDHTGFSLEDVLAEDWEIAP